MYGKVKDKLIAEWLEKGQKKEPKTREQLGAIRKEMPKREEPGRID